jgi:predicted RecA/RadA family phage recombinase
MARRSRLNGSFLPLEQSKMKNFLQPGETVELTAPSGGVVSGGAYLIGGLFGVAVFSAAEAEKFNLVRKGVFTFDKTTSQEYAEGDPLYFNPATGKLTNVAGSLRRVAIATAAAASADTTCTAVIIPSAGITVAALGTTVVADNTKASIDAAIATLVAKINEIAAGVR